jgi:molecular chaperone DnaJ
VAVQADWLEKDLYAVLGVTEDSDQKTIGRAYRKLARDLHPDTHPDDADAAERFKEVTAAYDVIGDPAKRTEYDEFRRAVAGERERASWRGGDSGPWIRYENDGSFEPEDLDDLFSSLLGRTSRRSSAPRRGADLEAVLEIGFEDAVRGLTTEVTLTGLEGQPRFKVRVPAGVEDGQRIRLAGKGGPGANGGPAGDLYAVVRVGSHPRFGRSGPNLTVDAEISWPEAVLGTEIEVPTLDGSPVRVRIPAGTPHGRKLRVRGHGVRGAGGTTGDLLVGIRVAVPDRVTDEQRQAVEAVAEAFRVA